MVTLDTLATNSLRKDVLAELQQFLGEKPEINLELVVDGLMGIQGFYCQCRQRKCAPHRCWPSKIGWGAVISLLVVVWYIYGASWLEWDGILRAQQVRLTEITQQTEAHVIQSLEEVSHRVSRLEAEKTVRRVLKRR